MEKINRQAGAEIEITDEMIEAGASALRRFSHDYESPEDGARRVFLDMIEAKASSKDQYTF